MDRPKTVFVLGAGASQHAGGPLMHNFLDIAEEIMRSGELGSADDKEKFECVFRGIAGLQNIYAKALIDLANIENVFAAFEMAKLLGTGQDTITVEGRDVDLLSAIRRLIVVTLERKIGFQRYDSDLRATNIYRGFADIVRQICEQHGTPPTVVTFNYDIGVDYAIFGIGRRYSYALPEDAPSGTDAVRLLKLHGSLNWGRCSDEGCRKVIPWRFDCMNFRELIGLAVTGRAEKSVVHLPVSSRLSKMKCCDKRVEAEPVIVPPTWNKGEHHKVLQPVWQAAAQDLGEAENIFVIGYSLPESDFFFRYLYALGTASDVRIKRFVVFDPQEKGGIEERYKALLGPLAEDRFRYKKCSFSESLSIVRDELNLTR